MNIQSNTPATSLEVADIFRDHGPAWRAANAGHISLAQMGVMSAIERCRTAALGGHVARCLSSRNKCNTFRVVLRWDIHIHSFPCGSAARSAC